MLFFMTFSVNYVISCKKNVKTSVSLFIERTSYSCGNIALWKNSVWKRLWYRKLQINVMCNDCHNKKTENLNFVVIHLLLLNAIRRIMFCVFSVLKQWPIIKQ